jgi:hypothetical protein
MSVAAVVALSMWACVENANVNKPANTNANSNANAAASKAPPTVDALMAQEKAANEAYTKGDAQFFQGFLADKFTMNEMGRRVDKAEAVKMIGGVKCDVKSMNVDEGKLSMIDADTYAVVYKTTMDGTCTFEGKTEKAPSPVRSATVWVRGSGDKWQPIWHGETAITDPKNAKPPAPPAPAAGDKSMSNSNSNSNTAAAPQSDANIDAMIAVEKAGWEAWKARDANKLGTMVTNNVSFVDLFGNFAATKDDTIKMWTGGTCTINSTSVTDTSGMMISPTVGMIFFKGSADGTCGDMKVAPVYGMSVYEKSGDTWKLAFGFEKPA